MRFRQLVRAVDTTDYYSAFLNPRDLKAQYNPERFHFWKSLHKGPEKEVLNMMYSPHYLFLKGHPEAYWQLQTYYGRGKKWIENKIKQFNNVFESIQLTGFNSVDYVVVLERPLVKNPHNDGFEIYEGHHRVACALVLGYKQIMCDIVRRRK